MRGGWTYVVASLSWRPVAGRSLNQELSKYVNIYCILTPYGEGLGYNFANVSTGVSYEATKRGWW